MKKFVIFLSVFFLVVSAFRLFTGNQPISASKALARLSNMDVSMIELVQEVTKERTELEQALEKEWRTALDGDGIIETIRNVWYLLRDGFNYLLLWLRLPYKWSFFIVNTIYDLLMVLWSLVFVA